MNSFLLRQIKQIDLDDLDYIQRDLCTYELVSLGFLLFGEERSTFRTTKKYVLQLLISGYKAAAQLAGGSSPKTLQISLLKCYAKAEDNWREYLVEALCIIGAKRVLSKLGFQWFELKTYFLPQIKEFSVHVHPILKALYKICDQMTEAQSGQLISYIDDTYNSSGRLQFYDSQYTEIFLLNWMDNKIIAIGDRNGVGHNLSVLTQYFKLNELDQFKTLIQDTLKFMGSDEENTSMQQQKIEENLVQVRNLDRSYRIRPEFAGIILIINQREFRNAEKDASLENRSLTPREGTDTDCNRLKDVFGRRGYIHEVFNDVESVDMLSRIREAVKRSVMKDSIIVCILSHGYRGHVYGSDSKAIKIDDIEEALSSETLKEKPKLLVIQACQTDNRSIVESGNSMNPNIEHRADMLIAMSVLPGHVAIRHSKQGSWFIQSLCDMVEKYGDENNMFSILTTVNDDVSRKRGPDSDHIMVTQTSSSLRKDFFLPKKLKD